MLLLVGTVAFAGIGMLMAGTLRAEANLALANGLFLVLLFLGGMAYPLEPAARRARGDRRGAPRRRAVRERARRALAGRAFPLGSVLVLLAWAVVAPLAAAASSAGRSEPGVERATIRASSSASGRVERGLDS